MAWAAVGALGTAGSTGADQSSLALTTTGAIAANTGVGVIVVAVDNYATSDQDEGAVTSITDSSGAVSWTKVVEWTKATAAAQDGVVCSLWIRQPTAGGLASGQVITINFSNNTVRDASAATGHRFTIASGSKAFTVGADHLTGAGVTLTSLAALDLTTENLEHLRVRGIAGETTSTTSPTVTASWTLIARSTAGVLASGEFRIYTGTNAASDPSHSTTADWSTVIAALKEEPSPRVLTANDLITGTLRFGNAYAIDHVANSARARLQSFGEAPWGTDARSPFPLDELAAANDLIVGGLTFGTPVMGVKVLLGANDLRTGALTLGTPLLKIVLSALSLRTGVLVFGTPLLKKVLTALDLTTSALTFGTPALKKVLTAIELRTGALTFGTPLLKKVLSASSLRTSAIAFGTATFHEKNALGANSLVVSGVRFQTPAIGQNHHVSGNNLVTGGLTLAQPVIHQNHHVSGTPLVPSALRFGTPTLANWKALTANNLVIGALRFGTPLVKIVLAANNLVTTHYTSPTPIIYQKHVLVGSALVTGPPTWPTPTIHEKQTLPAASPLRTGGIIFATPSLSQKHVLPNATPLVLAQPTFATPTLGQNHHVTADPLVLQAPTLAQPTLFQKHALAASSLVTFHLSFGLPTLFEIGLDDLILEDYTLDGGLEALDEATAVYVCDGNPIDYGEATSGKALGHKSFGAGNVFGSPGPASTGRKIASVPVLDGDITGDGTVSRWALVDEDNSRLLATGRLSGGKAVTSGTKFALQSIVVVITGRAP